MSRRGPEEPGHSAPLAHLHWHDKQPHEPGPVSHLYKKKGGGRLWSRKHRGPPKVAGSYAPLAGATAPHGGGVISLSPFPGALIRP